MRALARIVLGREPRARGVASGGIADQAGEIADQEDHLVAELLELAHLVDQHRVPEVQIGRGGIESGLDLQRRAALELALQLAGQQQVLRTARQLGHLFLDVLVACIHVVRRNSSRPRCLALA